MVTWSVAADYSVTAALKAMVARERPVTHFNNADLDVPDDPNESFPSGHSSSAFAMVFSTASSCRLLGCEQERGIWIVGLPLAAGTAYLRIAADKHYLTDVLAGAALGAAVGWFIPKLYATLGDGQPIPGGPTGGYQDGSVVFVGVGGPAGWPVPAGLAHLADHHRTRTIRPFIGPATLAVRGDWMW